MESKRRDFFLPIRVESWNSDRRVTSSTLLEYLFDPYIHELPSAHFDSHLDVPILYPAIHNLYEYQGYDYLRQEGMRANFNSNIDDKLKQLEGSPLAGEYKNIQNYVNAVASVEGLCVMYFDKRSDGLMLSPITYGKHGEVNVNYMDYISSDKIPVVTFHSHPEDGLFSPVDFSNVLLSVNNGESRFMNGNVVVCPNMQLLALATPQTPLLRPGEVDGLVRYWSEDSNIYTAEQRERQQRLVKRREDLFKGISRDLHRTASDYVIHNRQLREVLEMGAIDMELYKKGLGIIDNDTQRYFSRKRRFVRKFMSVDRRLITLINFASNSSSIAFAREMNIELFVSTNKFDFWKFTA